MKYNYYVDGFKTTHTTFAWYLCRAIGYSKNTLTITKEIRKKANSKIIFSRKVLSANLVIKVSWTAPYPLYKEGLKFEITKAE